MIAGLISLLFKTKLPQALTVLSTCMAGGALTGAMIIASGLFTLTHKVYFVIAVDILAIICYITQTFLSKKTDDDE